LENSGSDRASKKSNTNNDTTSQNLILLNSVQGSLGTIVDTLRQVGFTPEANIDTAIRIVQSEDTGLSIDDQSTLASLFSDSPNKAAVFRALIPGEARDMWIKRELERYRSQ
jgi:Tfp pilus assembly protein PilW